MLENQAIKNNHSSGNDQTRKLFTTPLPPTYNFSKQCTLIQELLCLELLKETVTPLDSSDLVQVLDYPQHTGWYITVESVTQNVFPVESPLIEASSEKSIQPEGCRRCGEKVAQETPGRIMYTVSDKNCFFCQSRPYEFSERCSKCGLWSCYCTFCYTLRFVQKMVEDKTRLHNSYLEQSFDIDNEVKMTRPQVVSQQDQPQSQNYYLVRFWNDQHDCVGRYYLETEKTKLFGGHLFFFGDAKAICYNKEISEGRFVHVSIDFQKVKEESATSKLRPLSVVSSFEKTFQPTQGQSVSVPVTQSDQQSVIKTAEALKKQIVQTLKIGQQKVVCSYPLLISQSVKAENELMIANLQLNAPQISLNFGSYTVVDFTTESQLETMDQMTENQQGLQYQRIFVLVRKSNQTPKVIRLKIDCYGIDAATTQINWAMDKKQPYFWEKQFKPKFGDKSSIYQPRVLKVQQVQSSDFKSQAQKTSSQNEYSPSVFNFFQNTERHRLFQQSQSLLIEDTELLLTIRKHYCLGKTFAHIQAVPSNREVTLVPKNKSKGYKFDFLPNDLACYHNHRLFLVFCTATNMLLYADKGSFDTDSTRQVFEINQAFPLALDQDSLLSLEKQVIQVGNNSFYKQENSWCQGENMKEIEAQLSLKLGRALSEYRVLKYVNDTFYLFEAFSKSIEFDIEATQSFELQGQSGNINVQCIEIGSYLINLVFRDAGNLFAATENYLICFLFKGQYKVTIKTQRQGGNFEQTQKQIQLKCQKLEQGQEACQVYDFNYQDSLLIDSQTTKNVVEIHVKEKIKSETQNRVIIWDLDEDELVKVYSQVSDIVTRDGSSQGRVQNQSRSLIQSRTSSSLENYFTLDDLTRAIICQNQPDKISENFAAKSLLFANFRNSTLLSIFAQHLDASHIEMISNKVLAWLNDKRTDAAQMRSFQRNLRNILILPCYAETELKKISQQTKLANRDAVGHMSRFFVENSLHEQIDLKVRQNVLQQALQNTDTKPFIHLLNLLIRSSPDEISLYDVVHKPSQLKRLIRINKDEVKLFLELCNKETAETRLIEDIEIQNWLTRISFTHFTTELKKEEIRTRLTAEMAKPNGFLGFYTEILLLLFGDQSRIGKWILKKLKQRFDNLRQSSDQLTVRKIKVNILEIEWLERSLTTLLQVVISDDSNFDNQLVQNLQMELNPFWYPLFTFIFMPFMLYFCLVTYYFSFVISDAYQPRTGFADGSQFSFAIRIMILILTCYQFLVEFLSVKDMFQRYRQEKKKGEEMKFEFFQIGRWLKSFMLLLNVWIITEHSTKFMDIGLTRVAQVASIEQFQLWYYIMEWMRIFDGTAVYVRLIQETVWNTRYFMVMLLLIIFTFGSSFLILDRQVKITKQIEGTQAEYVQVQTASMGYDVTDSFIYQYLVMYGAATQDGFESNPNRVLLWIYYIGAIFLTNVTFLNLLIAVMSTTYETVMETKERGVLIERTRIYYENIGALNAMYPVINNKFNRRYMYVATVDTADDQSVGSKLESDIASFKKDIRNEVFELKKLMQGSKIDSIKLKSQMKKIKSELNQKNSKLDSVEQNVALILKEVRKEQKH